MTTAKTNFPPFKLYYVYLDALNLSNVGDLPWMLELNCYGLYPGLKRERRIRGCRLTSLALGDFTSES